MSAHVGQLHLFDTTHTHVKHSSNVSSIICYMFFKFWDNRPILLRYISHIFIHLLRSYLLSFICQKLYLVENCQKILYASTIEVRTLNSFIENWKGKDYSLWKVTKIEFYVVIIVILHVIRNTSLDFRLYRHVYAFMYMHFLYYLHIF